jgi:hypothetical protein
VALNTAPTQSAGVVYGTAGAALPATEADLGAPFENPYVQAIAASVVLTVAGSPGSVTAYVVLQTDAGDGQWVDLSWAKLTANANGASLFWLSAGAGSGSVGGDTFQQSRANGTAPAATGSNAAVPGPRFRFTGQAAVSGGSSPTVTATVRYNLVPFR